MQNEQSVLLDIQQRFLMACATGQAEQVEQLLNQTQDNQALSQQLLNAVDKDGNTALHLACMNGNKTLIRALLPRISNFQYVNNKRQTTIMCYLQTQYDRVTLQLMLKYLNDFEQTANLLAVRDDKSESAMDYSCRRKDIFAIEVLLRHGAKLERNAQCHPFELLGNLRDQIILELDKHGALIGQTLPNGSRFPDALTLQGDDRHRNARVKKATKRIKTEEDNLKNLRAKQVLLAFPTIFARQSKEEQYEYFQEALRISQIAKDDFIKIVSINLLQCTEDFSEHKEVLLHVAMYLSNLHDWLSNVEIERIQVVLDDLNLYLEHKVRAYLTDVQGLLRKRSKKYKLEEVNVVLGKRDLVLKACEHLASNKQEKNYKAIIERDIAFPILHENPLQAHLHRILKLEWQSRYGVVPSSTDYLNSLQRNNQISVRINQLYQEEKEASLHLGHLLSHVRKAARQFPGSVEISQLQNAIDAMNLNVEVQTRSSTSQSIVPSVISRELVTIEDSLNKNREDIFTLLENLATLVEQLNSYHRETTAEAVIQALKMTAAIQFALTLASCLVALSAYCVAMFYTHHDARYVLAGSMAFAFGNFVSAAIEKSSQYTLQCFNHVQLLDQLPMSTLKPEHRGLQYLVFENLKRLDAALQSDFPEEAVVTKFHRSVAIILNEKHFILEVRGEADELPATLDALMQHANIQRKPIKWQFFQPSVQIDVREREVNERSLLLEGVGSINGDVRP